MSDDVQKLIEKSSNPKLIGEVFDFAKEAYKDKYRIQTTDFLNSLIADRCSIALPLFPSMSQEEFDFICYHIETYSKQLK